MKSQKVLVLRSELLPYSETFIRAQVLAYSAWKPVLVGTRPADGGLPLEGITVRYFPDHARTSLGRAYRKVLQRMWMAPPDLVSQLRGEGASLVHVHFATEAVQFWPVIHQLNVPIVITLHGFDINTYREWWENEWPSYSGRRYPSRLLRLSKHRRVHFVAVSESIRQRAIEYGIASDRITVRYIGIDLSQFQNRGPRMSQRPQRILYVGRLVEKKGGNYLIRAFAEVRRILSDAELVMIGDGERMNEYQALAQALAVPVTFLGSVPSSEVQNQMAQARIFCLPSVRAKNGDAEGLPISILEAQACGVPVVTSASGGATEGILDGITGYAFPEGDVTALSGRLLQLLTDSSRSESMSAAAPSFVAGRFDIQKCTRSLEELYNTLAQSEH